MDLWWTDYDGPSLLQQPFTLLILYIWQKTGDIPKQLSSHADFLEYLQSVERNPSSLQQLTRLRIRQEIQEHPLDKIQQLPLPASLKDFLALQEIK